MTITNNNKYIQKIVVFDIDETLGYFLELGILWDSILAYKEEKKSNITLNQTNFNTILDLYPEFLRPNILMILNYLKYKKQIGDCNAIMIYTNNQGPRDWINYIKNYFESKVGYKLFDQIIAAFKINGKRIEICRTTHNKTVDDFFRCTKLPQNVQICFLDDILHPHMTGENVYYIKVNPYVYNLPFEKIVTRLIKSSFCKKYILEENNENFASFIFDYMKNKEFSFVEKSQEEYEIDKIVTKKTMYHLQDFFDEKIKKYRSKKSIKLRHYNNKYNKTRKNKDL